MRWSPINTPYVKATNAGGFTIDGFASTRDGTLNWIVVDMERAEYYMGNTVSSTRVRYLQALDASCSEITTINSLSISCDGSAMPTTNKTSDIVNFTRLYQLPNAYQVANGLDMNNFKAVKNGSVDLKAHNYVSVTVTGLNTSSTYAFFAALTGKDGDTVLYSLKEETLQAVVTTLCKRSNSPSARRVAAVTPPHLCQPVDIPYAAFESPPSLLSPFDSHRPLLRIDFRLHV